MKLTGSIRGMSLEGGGIIGEARKNMGNKCRDQGVWLVQSSSRSDI